MQVNIESIVERWFHMTDEVWARHTNPWSVWTRYPCLPLLAVSIWSRVWIGNWAWLPVALSLIWIWLNPRVFSKPATTENWASKSVLGERIWLNRSTTSIAAHHKPIIVATNVIAALGAIACIAGLITLHAWSVILGVTMTMIGKSWFLDRMVWLYEEQRRD